MSEPKFNKGDIVNRNYYGTENIDSVCRIEPRDDYCEYDYYLTRHPNYAWLGHYLTIVCRAENREDAESEGSDE